MDQGIPNGQEEPACFRFFVSKIFPLRMLPGLGGLQDNQQLQGDAERWFGPSRPPHACPRLLPLIPFLVWKLPLGILRESPGMGGLGQAFIGG